MIGWIAAAVSVIAALVSVYFALDSQVSWWSISGEKQRARRLDRWLRRVNPLRAETRL